HPIPLPEGEGVKARYRAGPLTVPGDEELPIGVRGPHGEPPADISAQRFATANQAFQQRFTLALDNAQLRKNLLYYQRTWRWQRAAAVEELVAPAGAVPSLTLDPETVTAEPKPEDARKETDPGRYAPTRAYEHGEDEDFEALRRRLA